MKSAQSKDSLHSTASEITNNEIFRLGDQVKMKTGGGRIGIVAFIGPTDFQTGIWIGVILEKPEGKNNGTVDGRTYFQCKDKYGVFCRPNNLIKLNNNYSSIQSPLLAQRSQQQHRRVPSPTNSIASSFAPSIAASQLGGIRKDHSPYALEYGYDIGERVNTNDGRVGKIKFLNLINGQVYAGILLDKPVGNSSGEFNNIQYFKCYPKYAVFLPAEQVKRSSRTESSLPPKIAPKQTTSSKLRYERRGGLDGNTNAGASSWRGSLESLDSAISPRSPKSPQPKYGGGGTMKQSSFSKDNEVIAGLKKCLQEKEAHLTKLSNELEERRCDSERLAQENKSLKLRVGELDFNCQELVRERAELQSSIASNEKRLEDLSFCFTESEVQRSELEQKLIELKKMPSLFEEDDGGRGDGTFLDGETSTRGPSISALIDSQLLLPLDEFNNSKEEEEKTFIEFDGQTKIIEDLNQKHFDFGIQVNYTNDIIEKEVQTDDDCFIKEKLIFEDIGIQTEEIEEKVEEIKTIKNNNFTQTEEKLMKDSINQTDIMLLMKDSSNQTDLKLMEDSANQTDEIIKPKTCNTIIQTLSTSIKNKDECNQTLPILPPKKQSISIQTEEEENNNIPVLINFVESSVQTDDNEQLIIRKESFDNKNNNNNISLDNLLQQHNNSTFSTSSIEVLELNVAQLPFNNNNDIFKTSTSSDDNTKNLLYSPNTLNKKLKEKIQDFERLEQQNSFLNQIIADQQKTIESIKKMSIGGGGGDKRNGGGIDIIDEGTMRSSNNAINTIKTQQRKCRLYCDYCERFDSHITEECPIEEARREEKRTHIIFSPK